jgi:hypothetical protein
MRFVIRAAVVAGIVALSNVPSAQTDPHVGTWKLNLTKSKYNTGQAPRSSTVVVEAAGQGTKITATTILSDGTTRTIRYTAGFDGQDAAVSGTRDYDKVSLTRTGNTIKGTRKVGGKPVQTFTTVVSADGKTRTTTTTGTDAAGKKVDNMLVYDKQ